MPKPNQKRRGGVRAVIAWCVVVGAMAMPAAANALESASPEAVPSETTEAANPAGGPEPLELAKVSPEGQKIVLGPLPDADGAFTGHLTVLVVNNTEKTERLALRYLQDAGLQSNPMANNTTGAARMNGSPTAVKLQPGSPTPIRLVFELPKGKTASWLAGKLLISGTSKLGKTEPGSLVLPVSAEFQPLQELTFNPSSLTIQVTRGWSSSTTPEVEVTGPGAPALLAHQPPLSTRVLLGNGEGHDVEATFGQLKEVEGTVRGTLSLSDHAPPGEYTGNLILGAGSDAPGLALTVKSHVFVLWFILLVLAGSLVGGLLPKLTSTGRRRTALRLTLGNSIQLYERERAKVQLKALPWDMDARMGRKPWLRLRWNAIPGSDGYAGLYAQLRWGRSEDELDELSQKVTAAANDVIFWIELRQPVVRLNKLNEGQPPPPRNGKTWRETQVAQDTDALLDHVRNQPPTNSKERRELEVRCTEQALWHGAVVDAWTVITAAQTSKLVTGEEAAQLAELDFGPIVNGKPECERAGKEAAELLAALSGLAARARAIASELPPLAVESRGPGTPEPSVEETARAVVESLDEDTPPDTEDEESTQHALQKILFTDIAMTLLIATGSVVVYVTPLYSSTWGSTTDLLAAAAAGFGTQVVVQWAAVPLVQSLFSKSSVPQQSTAAAPGPAKAPPPTGS
jgi:hypothetical protein